ncbi:IS21 family transposase [Salinimonas sediminis]|uniref:IS21 family transposase n=1 Tax=Salinimonas sediminis TaxID=2303538 RepID=A0A346NJR9_9ALTE|nr:IS21 family transposase [Salinimonas sediminis]AXR05776.1 IS21 family transposase [Salinimonas sediminis]
MPTKRLSMRQLREILRLKLQADLSVRQIHRSLRVSVGAVSKVLSNASVMKLSWADIDALDDVQLANRFYPQADTRQSTQFEMPDWRDVHQELTHKGVTKHLLWEEYTEQYPNRCYSYPQYCHHYQVWQKSQRRSMRQTHKAGEKLFVDYAGQTVPVVGASTGEVRHAQVFVAVMGASNHTFAEGTWTQSLPDWLGSHARAFNFFGGVPQLVIPDNLKSGVSKACRYDPDVTPAYQQLAAHYGCAIVPARPYKPKDKAKAEVGVQVIERWILARLRHYTFFSLTELNTCIAALLKDVNNRSFKQLNGSRQSWFESIDKPALAPLPKLAYQYTDIKTVKVNIDYHIQYDTHLYSVPHHLVGERIDVHASNTLITLYFHNKVVASHARQYRHGMSTVAAHMPTRHQKHQSWTPGRLMNWAKDIGDEVLVWVKYQLASKSHQEQAYRVCLGLLNLSRQYPSQRLNKACAIANQQHLYRLKQVKAILTSNQDKLYQHNQDESQNHLPQTHENIRGPQSFH